MFHQQAESISLEEIEMFWPKGANIYLLICLTSYIYFFAVSLKKFLKSNRLSVFKGFSCEAILIVSPPYMSEIIQSFVQKNLPTCLYEVWEQ